jgi:acyl-CoA reductase-like NAD-dependent aldehyde dehydrogenase
MLEFGEGSPRLESFDPWNGEKLGSAACTSDEQVHTALDAAWNRWLEPSNIQERCATVANAAEAIERNFDALVELLIRETGKPVTFAKGEVRRMAHTFRLASRLGSAQEFQPLDVTYDERAAGYSVGFRRFPVGPIAGFVPYNWPFNLAAHKIAPAFVAGCPIVLKASPLAPLCTFFLAQLLHEAGIREPWLKVVHLSNEQAQRLVQDPRIQMLSFTGSAKVGWMLKTSVPKKKTVLELGGNAPVIICPDADVEHAVSKAVTSGYGYAGQVCISAQNVFAHTSIYDDVRTKLIEATLHCPTGDPREASTVCGPLIDRQTAQKVRQTIESAVASGAKVIAKVEGVFPDTLVEPSLIEGADAESEIVCEEVFGPVLTLNRYESLDDLCGFLNAGRYRLQASVFTNDNSIAETVFSSLRFGGIVHNDSPSVRFDSMPYGGEGDSGFGREGVQFALEEMCELRALISAR